MLKSILSFLICLFLVRCAPKDLPTNYKIGDHLIEVKLSHMTTKSEMNHIAQQIRSQNITMDYGGSTFFDNGRLQDLKLKVHSDNDLINGQCTATLVLLQYSYFGFKILSDGSFSIGKIE